MLKALLGWIGLGGPEHEAKVLARDARSILQMIHAQHAAPSLEKIAEVIRTQTGTVHERGLGDPQYYGRGVTELTELNRAARARRDNVTWSGITLAIIYIKAEMLGEPGLPAKHAIDGFLDTWSHASQDAADSGGETPETGGET